MNIMSVLQRTPQLLTVPIKNLGFNSSTKRIAVDLALALLCYCADDDAVGNRTSMNDGLGSVTYTYNQLSRMTSEARTFSDPANASIDGLKKAFPTTTTSRDN